MSPWRLCLLLLSLTSTSVSCATASGSARFDADRAPSSGQSMLVIYRSSGVVNSAAMARLHVDGRDVGELAQQGARSVALDAGDHQVQVEVAGGMFGTRSLRVSVQPGEVGYVRVDPVFGNFTLSRIDDNAARAIIGNYVDVGSVSLVRRTSSSPAPPEPSAAEPPRSPASSSSSAARGAELPRMLVMPMNGDAIDASTRQTMTQLLVTYLAGSRRFLVLSSEDVERLVELTVERQKLDCGTEACLAEIGNAYGARFVAYSQVAKLGDVLLVHLTLFDVERALPVGREVAQASSLTALPNELEQATARLLPPR